MIKPAEYGFQLAALVYSLQLYHTKTERSPALLSVQVTKPIQLLLDPVFPLTLS